MSDEPITPERLKIIQIASSNEIDDLCREIRRLKRELEKHGHSGSAGQEGGRMTKDIKERMTAGRLMELERKAYGKGGERVHDPELMEGCREIRRAWAENKKLKREAGWHPTKRHFFGLDGVCICGAKAP